MVSVRVNLTGTACTVGVERATIQEAANTGDSIKIRSIGQEANINWVFASESSRETDSLVAIADADRQRLF